MIAGVDLSNNQPIARFDQIAAAGYGFCIHKISEGVGFYDRYLAARWPQMKAAGLARGVYHFARPSATSAAAEADYFLNCLSHIALEPGDTVWLDMEDERVPVGTSVSAWTLAWCARVGNVLGFLPGIYTYPAYVHERLLTHPSLAIYPLWWASYSETMRPAPAPWTEVAVWQYTSDGQVPGTGGMRIDLNHLLADDISALTDLGKPGLVAAAETPDEAYDAWCFESGDVVAWAGEIDGRAHWFGLAPQPVARTVAGVLLAYTGSSALDVTNYALDDWETVTKANGQLRIYGEPAAITTDKT
jgi:GH25 family lysozyme M1 (1,4-beta-N-acetylmuramidase)